MSENSFDRYKTASQRIRELDFEQLEKFIEFTKTTIDKAGKVSPEFKNELLNDLASFMRPYAEKRAQLCKEHKENKENNEKAARIILIVVLFFVLGCAVTSFALHLLGIL